MTNGQISGISYTGETMANALKLLPHIEANGFDGKHFMQTVMSEMKDLGIMRDSAITAVSHIKEVGNTIAHLIQNTGPVTGRG